MKRPTAALAALVALPALTLAAVIGTDRPHRCPEDEVAATFHAGPRGRMATICLPDDQLTAEGLARVDSAATAWQR